MENICGGTCENHNHKELSRKGLLAGLATILTGIGLSSLGNTAAEAATKYKVAKTSAVPVGSAKSFRVGSANVLITQPRAGVFRAFKNQCTHQRVQLGDQTLQGGTIMCFQHGATFNADNGAVAGFGPARNGLTKYTASKSGNYIYVSV